MAQVDVKCPFCECTDAVKSMVWVMLGTSAIAVSHAAVLSSSTMCIAPASLT
jgi:hypothetical protein